MFPWGEMPNTACSLVSFTVRYTRLTKAFTLACLQVSRSTGSSACWQ